MSRTLDQLLPNDTENGSFILVGNANAIEAGFSTWESQDTDHMYYVIRTSHDRCHNLNAFFHEFAAAFQYGEFFISDYPWDQLYYCLSNPLNEEDFASIVFIRDANKMLEYDEDNFKAFIDTLFFVDKIISDSAYSNYRTYLHVEQSNKDILINRLRKIQADLPVIDFIDKA